MFHREIGFILSRELNGEQLIYLGNTDRSKADSATWLNPRLCLLVYRRSVCSQLKYFLESGDGLFSPMTAASFTQHLLGLLGLCLYRVPRTRIPYKCADILDPLAQRNIRRD